MESGIEKGGHTLNQLSLIRYGTPKKSKREKREREETATASSSCQATLLQSLRTKPHRKKARSHHLRDVPGEGGGGTATM